MHSLPDRRSAVVACVLVALGSSLGGCDRGAAARKPAEPAPVAVVLVSPSTATLPRTLRVTGSLFGDEDATVAAKVAGRVAAVYKDLGDVAQPDEPLLRVDPTDYELARAEKARAFTEALAKLGLVALPGAGFQVDALPAVQRARVQAANAKARFERTEQLVHREPPLISAQELADVRTAWEVAENGVNVERLAAGAAVAQARTLEAQLRIAEQAVADTVHKAPAPERPAGASAEPPAVGRSYEVAARLVSVGDFVQVGTPLVRLVDADPVKLRATVPERRLADVKVGQSAAVSIEAFREPFAGRVSRVSPAVDVATRSFAVEVLVPNPERRLKPGSFASAEIEVGSDEALLVPASAILTFAGVTKVMVEKDGKAEERPVAIGQRLADRVEVRDGLRAGDRVVEKPVAGLRTGTPIVSSSAPPARAGAPPS